MSTRAEKKPSSFCSGTRRPIRVVIVGAAGYAGAEAVGLIAHHPGAELVGLFGSSRHAERAERFDRLFPRFRGVVDLAVEGASVEAVCALTPDVAILATPHEASHELAAALVGAGIVVLDLSAAYRLRDRAAYPRYYGFEHSHASLLAEAVYGLPEFHRDEIAGARLIAVPGCYPTSVIIALRPIVEAGFIARGPIIVDSTSGVSGAGRSPALKSMLCEVSQQAYGVLSHRHEPEMIQEVGADLVFTPHLGPYDRGILSTIHATLHEGVDDDAVRDVLRATHANEPFVRILDAGQWPTVAAVEGSNCCDIALAVDARRAHLILSSAIDNLLKGAAGQAIQCMNLRFGLPETMGLGRCNAPIAAEAAQ
jgi:N-acetyl-gamma-glutamyl-phosphate reductase